MTERMTRCAWKTDLKIGRWFLPQCTGGAVYGEGGCTCSAGPTLRERMDRLEAQVADLTMRLATRPVCDATGEEP